MVFTTLCKQVEPVRRSREPLIFQGVLHKKDDGTVVYEMDRSDRQNLETIRPVLASGAVFLIIFTFQFYRLVFHYIFSYLLFDQHPTQNELWFGNRYVSSPAEKISDHSMSMVIFSVSILILKLLVDYDLIKLTNFYEPIFSRPTQIPILKIMWHVVSLL